MKALLTGIYALYTALPHNSLYTALYSAATRPGLYLDNVPQGAAFPYCVYGVHSRDFDDQMDDEHESITVYFNVYSQTGQTNALDLLDKLTELFDDAVLTVSGYSPLYMTRDTVVPLHDLGDDTPIFGYAVHYEVLLET